MAAMADSKLSGMLASAVVKVARDKLETALENLAAATMPEDVKLRRHLEELKQRMEAIAEVAGVVERRSTREGVVREWLMRCEVAAYGIWDMVDEIQANQWKPVTEMHRRCLPIAIATARKGRTQSAIENLDDLVQHGQEKLQQPVDDDAPIKPSFADHSEDDYIVGAELDRRRIMNTILSAARDKSSGLVFVPIVGMGGVGKTTLAQMVFNDAELSDYARAWVDVSQRFDLKEIGNCILSEVLSNKGEHQDSSDVELIMKRLDEFIHAGGGNKLLVVLDDLWSDEDLWSDHPVILDLRRMLGAAKEGSKVIVMVTTRNETVAGLLGADIIHRLVPRPPVLVSYQSMPPNLKLCFAYCAIFPHDHNILKDDLIHHWTALQLIQPSDTVTTTQVANEYIDMLLDMSFLQRTIRPFLDHSCEVPTTLQNLVHDLATEVSYNNHHFFRNSYRKELLTNSSGKLSARLRAFSFHGCSNKQLTDDWFSSAKYLRVLDLRGCCLQKLPDSICQLVQLSYLNLSGSTRLVNLPDSFGNLINLGHIDLSGCVGLKCLPSSFGLLEKLEHLDLSSCSCLEGKGIQSALGGLTNLQHLNLSHPCCYIAEHRFHLKVPKNIWDKLTNLRYLNLSMCLNPILCYLPEKERDEYVDCISGLHSLEHLDLSHNIFLSDIPQSLGKLSQLQTLNLFGCARLKRIDKWMGEKKLQGLSSCLGLEACQFVVCTDEGTKSSNLGLLKGVSCKELEISCIEKVLYTEDAQSIGLTGNKKLQKLTLVWSPAPDFWNDGALLGVLVPPRNLRCLQVHGYRSRYLPAWLTSRLSSHLPNLVEVSMVDIPNCGDLPAFGVLPSLQRLILRRVAKVTRIDTSCLTGGSKAAFHGLLHVTLDDMVNLEEFNNCSSSSDELVMFPTLEELVINKCPKLKFGDSPPKARMLVISDCVHLMSSSVVRGEHDTVEDPSSSTSTAITCAPLTAVVIESCKAPQDELKWSLLQGLAPLHSIHIRNCGEKIISPEIMKDHLSSLKLLCFSHCDSMTYLPEHVVQETSLQELIIHECHGIKSLPQSICEEKKKHYPRLLIRWCPELEKWFGELEENKKKFAQRRITFFGQK